MDEKTGRLPKPDFDKLLKTGSVGEFYDEVERIATIAVANVVCTAAKHDADPEEALRFFSKAFDRFLTFVEEDGKKIKESGANR